MRGTETPPAIFGPVTTLSTHTGPGTTASAEPAGLTWQATLFGDGEPGIDASFTKLVRRPIDRWAWVDLVPAWLGASDVVFEQLVVGADWKQRDRVLFGEMVREPRLTSRWLGEGSGDWGGPPSPVLSQMRRALSDRYCVDFDSGSLNLYRGGRDSVAWHRDKIPAQVIDPIVAIVSVGEPRRYLLRPRGGGRSVSFYLGGGDLLVTGGTAQRTWEHSVPKVASAGPRISITFRHSR